MIRNPGVNYSSLWLQFAIKQRQIGFITKPSFLYTENVKIYVLSLGSSEEHLDTVKFGADDLGI